jgi:hypothetical protein
MRVIGKLQNQDGKWYGCYLFFCPGCKFGHAIHDEKFVKIDENGNPERPAWTFNGNEEKPTFSPSYLCQAPRGDKMIRCHSYIKDGMIQFLADCSHELAGKTVPMEDYEAR